MMKKAPWLFYVISFWLIAGCGKKDAGECSANGSEAFFKSSIDGYYKRSDQQAKAVRYSLVEGAHYDATTNWWMVPFDMDGEKLQALISCDGRLEITGR